MVILGNYLKTNKGFVECMVCGGVCKTMTNDTEENSQPVFLYMWTGSAKESLVA